MPIDEAVVPSISALSPSGRLLASAAVVEQGGIDSSRSKSAAFGEAQRRRDQQQQHHLEGGNNDDCRASPALPQYQVVITSSKGAEEYQTSSTAAVAGRTWNDGCTPILAADSSSVDVSTCPVKAPVTALQWMDDCSLACGLQDGTVTIVIADRHRRRSDPNPNNDGRLLEHSLGRGEALTWTPALSRCFHRVQQLVGGGADSSSTRVMRIRLSGGGIAGGEAAAASGATRGSEPTLWVLYPDRVVVCVGVDAVVTYARQQTEENQTGSPLQQQIPSSSGTTDDDNASLHNDQDDPSPPAAGPSFAKLQLEGQGEVLDVVACAAPAGLFEVRSERHSHVILASGVSPALAFYPIGSESRSFGLASIAWAVASRVTSLTVGALDGLFGFVGLRGRGKKAGGGARAKAQGRRGANGGGGGDKEGGGEDPSPAPLVLHWDGGLQDGWRRVSRLFLGPSGRLAAAADGFGRVMLVDCATRQILRMWKGVRDAQCGWLEVVESWEGHRVESVGQKSRFAAAAAPVQQLGESVAATTPVVGLYLAILAPLRGRVELWRMRHGPCVRVISAPAGARLLTSRPSLATPSGDGGVSVEGIGKGRNAEALTNCFLLTSGAGGSEARKLRLSPLMVEEEDLADLPNRLSREPTVDDAYRLRKLAAAVEEVRTHGTTSRAGQGQLQGTATTLDVAGERGRLPAGQEAREDVVFQLLSQLESVESLAQATASLSPAIPKTSASSPYSTSDRILELSASFQRRVSALCRERAEQAAAGAETDGSKDKAAAAVAVRPAGNNKSGAAAAAVLRFRAAAFELYTVLESVELNPAGGDEDEDPAFLAPGNRGWKHGGLCEEAAGWADMVRETGGGAPLPSAELPDFQEFLETVAVVLEVAEEPAAGSRRVSRGGRDRSPPLLRFVGPGLRDRRPSIGGSGPGSRRTSRDSTSSADSARRSSSSSAAEEAGGASAPAAAAAADYARCRTRLFGWLFRPLLSDAFALASLTQALSLLGLGGGNGQAAVLVGDLAAWFLELPVGRAADTTVGREAQNCPVLRWLKGVILAWASSSTKRSTAGDGEDGDDGGSFLDRETTAPLDAESRMKDLFGDPVVRGGGVIGAGGKDDADGGKAASSAGVSSAQDEEEGSDGTVGDDADEDREAEEAGEKDGEEILRPMFEACAASQRLENASMLSVVTAEALAACREKLEESSLGQVAIGGGEAWVTLARRLRLCLFLDHRLHWGVLEQRDRASLRRFEEGKASVYAFVAKDQLMSFQDLSFAACSARERGEVEASARSQREAAEEAKAAAASGGRQLLMGEQRSRPSALAGEDGVGHAVAAASSLADAQMDEHWRAVQAVAARAGDSPMMAALGGVVPAVAEPRAGPAGNRENKPQREEQVSSPRGHSHRNSGNGAGAAEGSVVLPGTFPESPPTSLFFMRSHAQPIVLACHRTRWLVLSWASTGPRSEEALRRAVDRGALAESVRATEAAVRRLSLAVDHLSYLRTARPVLAGCVAYWLWEHGGVRVHVGRLARGFAPTDGSGSGSISGSGGGGSGGTVYQDGSTAVGAAIGSGLVKEGRPAREAFLAAAEEFLKVEALFSGRYDGARGSAGGNRRGAGGKVPGSAADVSFMSLLTEGAVQRCPWPGAWDRWVEECLRDAQVHRPLHTAVAAHSTLLRALRVSAVCGLPEEDTLGLFEQGRSLCAESSLSDENLASRAASGGDRRAAGGGGPAGVGVQGERHVVARRESYIRRALDAVVPRPAQNVYRLARDFGVSEDTVRGWHCLVLLRRGHDVLGEETLSQIFSLQDLAGDILTVMRLRLKRFLDFLETSPSASRGLLASLDADTCRWVRSARDPEAREKGQGGVQSEKEAGEPLRSTHGVLLCLARALPRESRQKLQADALVALVGTMLRHMGGTGASGAGYLL
ncbi:unnamed protein product [Ectocarpus sp. 4 AP-2014]